MDRTLHELLPEPHAPGGVVQWYGALLDEQGALWMDGYERGDHWGGWSRDGGRTMRTQHLPLEQPGGGPLEPTTVLGPGVAAVLSDQVAGDDGPSVGPWYLDLVSDYGRKIQRVTAKPSRSLAGPGAARRL